jgi:hypothetical protein
MSNGGQAAAADPAAKSVAIATAAAVATAIAIAGEQAQPQAAPHDASISALRATVISALEEASQGMLANMLDSGEWSLEGADLSIKVPASVVMIDMSFGAESRKLVNAAASQAAGRAIKIRLIAGGGANPTPASHRSTSRATGGGSARNRAADDPLVQYMQEKFNAEIRTVIDHTKKD